MKTGITPILCKTDYVFLVIKSDYLKRQNSACQNHTKTQEELTIISESFFAPETSSLDRKYNLQ